jgi:hypothetical protein
VGRAGSTGVDGESPTGIGGAGGVGVLTGVGGSGGGRLGWGGGPFGSGVAGGGGSAGPLGGGGDRVSPTGAGGGSGATWDAGMADASDGNDAGEAFCAIPSAPAVEITNIVLTWCDAAQTCAQCSWTTGGSIGGSGMASGRCALPPLLCPPSTSGSIAAGGVFPVCTAHPVGETYQGVLVELIGTTIVAPSVTVATSCAGLDNEGAGNLPVFGFDVTPCGLGRPTCVASCSDCP